MSFSRVPNLKTVPSSTSAFGYGERDWNVVLQKPNAGVEQQFPCASPGFLADSVCTRAAVMARAFLFQNPESWVEAPVYRIKSGGRTFWPMLEFRGGPTEQCEPMEDRGSAR